MHSLQEIIYSITYSMIFVGLGNFLCLFAVRERLRLGILPLVLFAVLQSLVYYGLRVISWLGILPYLALAFWLYCKVASVQPLKLLFMMLVVVTYLLFSNAVFFIFEGSSYTWDLYDLDTVLIGFACSTPLMAWLVRKKIWPILRSLDTEGIRWLWVIPTAFIIMNVVLCSSHIQSILSESLSFPYTLATSAFALATAGVCFLVLDMLRKTQEISQYQADMRLVDVQLATQHKRFAELTQYMDNIRVLRHDIRHHLRMLRVMLEEGETESALTYLKAYETDTERQEVLHVSQNLVGDIIARRSQEDARAQDIDLTIHCLLPAECWISDTDLCVVLGNLMENALNASAKLVSGHKYVKANAYTHGDEAVITIENSCNPDEVEPSDEGIAKGLGQGIPSIQAIARKYGGAASFKKNGDVFYAKVLLYRRRP